MDSKGLCRALAALLQFLDGQSTDAQRCALVPFLCVKKQRPHHGAQSVSQIPKGGEGNRGQMPHMCSGPPLGLNIDRCITQHTYLQIIRKFLQYSVHF